MNAITKLKDRIKPSSKVKKPLKIKSNGYETIKLKDIKKGTPFVDLFPINPETLKSITEDMKVNGFDVSQPVIIWTETNMLIDGHTRCEAAKKAGIKDVVVIYENFEDVDSALRYAYGLQFKRRNLTDADRFQFSETYVNNVGHGVKKSGRKKNELAEILSVSIGTAQKYITVINRGSDKTKESIRAGMLTINGAYKSLLDKEKQGSGKSDKKVEVVNKVKDDFKVPGRGKGGSKSEDGKNYLQIDALLIQKKLDDWGADIDVEMSNFFPFKERLLAVSEILPDGSYLKEYAQKLMDGGLKNECV
ncbi:MAG: ParB/Srx family N-terminal domain-containing protein [Spirochaetaceae bacterium]